MNKRNTTNIQPINFLPTNTDFVFVIDDFLKEQEYWQTERDFFMTKPNNYYNLSTGQNIETKNNKVLYPVHNKLMQAVNSRIINYKCFNGKIENICRSVLLISSDKSVGDFRHIDDNIGDYGYWTFSYHLSGEDDSGETLFFNNFLNPNPVHLVPFKQNRMVIFPSCYPHTGLSRKKRIIYSNFTKFDTPYNPLVWTTHR
jgi:hypothetical protein